MRPKLLTQTMEISETSVLSLQVPLPWHLERLSLTGPLTPASLSTAPSVGTALPQPPCLTHHHFPFRIQLRHHCPQEDSPGVPKALGRPPSGLCRGQGQGLGDSVTHRSWLQPPGASLFCPRARTGQICTCGLTSRLEMRAER